MSSLLSVLLLLASYQVEVADAQSTPAAPAAQAEVAPAAPVPSDPKAVAFLRQLAQDQFQSEQRRLVDGFQLQVYLRDKGESPREVGFTLDYRQRDGESIGLRIDDPERGRIDKGFDGRDYWLKEAEGEHQLLNGHEFAKDRESIDEALDMCQDLLLILDVAQMETRSRSLQLLPGQGGEKPAPSVLSGELRRADGSWVPFALEVTHQEDSLLPTLLDFGKPPSLLQEAPANPEGLPFQRFELRLWKTYDGRNVPRLIDIFDSNSPEALPVRMLEIHDFQCQTRWAPVKEPTKD